MRLKIIAGNVAIVVVLGFVGFQMVRGELRSELNREVDAGIANSQVLLDRSFRLSSIELLQRVEERAESKQLRDVFAGLDLNSRRTRAFEAAENVVAFMGDPARGKWGAPDIAAVVDETGRVVARNGARNLMFGQSLLEAVPALGDVLKDGEPRSDTWMEEREKKVLRTSIAAIAHKGTRLGALVVGYDLSNGVAVREATLLGGDVAFLAEGRVYSSSLDGSGVKALNDFLFSTNKATTQQVMNGELPSSSPWQASLAGQDYVAITAKLPGSISVRMAYVILANRTVRLELVGAANMILYTLVLGVILVAAFGFTVGTSILRPIVAIEEGVLAVINGNTDLRLETDSPELGGLAYRINQLLNVFTGTEEDTEDETGRISHPPKAGMWKDAAFGEAAPSAATQGPARDTTRETNATAGVTASDGTLDDPAVGASLAAEDEEAYYARVYDEYVAAKRALGEDVSNIPRERFVARLKGNAGSLVAKHGCRMVRFQVQTRGDQVVLRPVIIR
ncbi:MAG: hypothetical protein MJD61_21825 [Proteobacteria bacterium]|nr:hypothetical protein [Pseudomonadota bacterium]